MFKALFDIIFGPLLNLPDLWAILLVSVVLSFVTTLIYKYATNQDLMKRLKNEMNELKKEMKELKHDPQAAMAVNKKMMETNTKYMTQSMKPMIFTFLPIILIFGWLSAHFSYAELHTGQEFTVDALAEDFQGMVEIQAPEGIELTSAAKKNLTNSKATFTLKAQKEGEHYLQIKAGDSNYDVPAVVGKDPEEKTYTFKKPPVKSVTIGYEKNIVMNLFGWKLGWLGTYIIFSIISSMIIRKWMKIY